MENAKVSQSHTEIVGNKKWDRYARCLEKKNLKNFNRSLSAIGIARGAYDFIIQHYSDTDSMLVRTGWKEAMKNAAIVS